MRKSRIGFEDALALYDADLLEVGKIADSIRRVAYGNMTYFNINRHINPTNECEDSCKFCAYSATRKNPNPYTMSHESILQILSQSVQQGVTEVHIVGAHNSYCDIDWYSQLFCEIKTHFPNIHLKALTAAEVHFLALKAGKTSLEILRIMANSGVDSMPGGGAEIFDEEIRDRICKGKVSSTEWLKIHKQWHRMGQKSNCTMLFGHIESREHRIDHMLRLRKLQDETDGFQAFVPLVYQRENNYLDVAESPTGQEILKTIAIARIVLDNIPHIKAYWATSTIKLALVAQEFGANDLDGTIEKESIQSAAGARSENGIPSGEFIQLIKNSGFVPIERNSLYKEIRKW
jgi:aminodeoxyfutalosine synthase